MNMEIRFRISLVNNNDEIVSKVFKKHNYQVNGNNYIAGNDNIIRVTEIICKVKQERI